MTIAQQDDINVIALIHGNERYVVMFRDDRRDEAIETIGRWERDPDLSFDAADQANLTQRIYETVCAGK